MPSSPAGVPALARARPWLLLVASALAMALRAPVYLTAPSFWAEEGFFFYAHAWSHRWWETLTFAPAGYYLFSANVAALLAAAVPLTHAPLAMKLVALGEQLLPISVIAFGEAPLWQAPGRRALGAAAVIFGSLSGEVWLSTVNSQTYLVLAAVLVLLEPPARGRRAVLQGLLLVLCGLGGPVTAFLLPLFGWRAWRTRDRAAVAQAGIVAGCAAVQAGIVLAAPTASRLQGLDAPVAAAVAWMKALVLPTAGVRAANAFRDLLAWVVPDGDWASRAGRATGGLLALAAAAVLVWLARGARPGTRAVLVGSWALVTVLSILLSVGNKRVLLHEADVASRYFYAPGVLLLLLLLENLHADPRAGGRLRRAVCALLLVAGIVGGAVRYRASVRWRPVWPVWRDEVRAWQADPRHPLAIWPPGWSIALSPPPR